MDCAASLNTVGFRIIQRIDRRAEGAETLCKTPLTGDRKGRAAVAPA